MNDAEKKVSNFYNSVGWETEDGVTEDAKRWEDLRACATEYVSKSRRRVLQHIPESGKYILDMASGPIQYIEYLEYSKNYEKRYCVDLSSGALAEAKRKIGDHGVFLHGSFFDIPLEENFFDCAISLHTIYHIDKDRQEEAVRKLIKVTKPQKPVIIVYSNPNTITSRLRSSFLIRGLKRVKNIFRKAELDASEEAPPVLYFCPQPIEWWDTFRDVADVQIVPIRSFSAELQKKLIPDNKLGRLMLSVLFKMENRFPNFFVKHFRYPMIILTKRTG